MLRKILLSLCSAAVAGIFGILLLTPNVDAATTYLDRFNGAVLAAFGKAPVDAATTANITLSGYQTIDGVALNSDYKRVLVKNQTDTTTNGIYTVFSGTWIRSSDFSGPSGTVTGQLVTVTGGTLNSGIWEVTTANPIQIDHTGGQSTSPSNITFTQGTPGQALLSGNNTFTGTNNFTGLFKILGVTETFPASGLLVGTTDAQTLTNKSIAGSEINSGVIGSSFGGAGSITGALKANGSGLVTQAACADLSNGTASCSTDTTNAANISSGTLAAARGGAGTVNGALKANGSGAVSQAACSDLSNGATGCSTATGTSGATIPLLNANNTYSGTLNLTSAPNLSGTFTGSGTSANFVVNQSTAAASATSPEIGGQFTMTSNVGTANKGTAYKIGLTSSVVAAANSASVYGANIITQGFGGTYLVAGLENDVNNVGADATTLGAAAAVYGYVGVAAGSFKSTAGLWLTNSGVGSGWTHGVAVSNANTASYFDNSSAIYGVDIAGTHSDGVYLAAGTYSDNQILGTGFSVSPTGKVCVNCTSVPGGTEMKILTAPASAAGDGLIVTDGTRQMSWYNTGATYSYHGVGSNQNLIYGTGGILNILSDGSTIAFGTGAAGASSIDSTGSYNGASLISTGTKFTASGCTNSATVGGATAGKYASGTTGTCTVVVTMNGATGLTAPNGWACTANDLTTPADLIHQTATSTTTATLSGTTVSGDVINFHCTGY